VEEGDGGGAVDVGGARAEAAAEQPGVVDGLDREARGGADGEAPEAADDAREGVRVRADGEPRRGQLPSARADHERPERGAPR
jgi:hypothetical protein